MENTNELQKPRSPQERVTVSRETAVKLDRWLSELQSSIRGLKISRSDLVNWLVHRHTDVLSNQQVQQIKENFFDEVEFTEWALKEMKEARGRGEKLSLSDLLGSAAPAFSKDTTRRKRNKQCTASDDAGAEVSFTQEKEDMNEAQ